ncbi:hypothetical protein HYW68_01465, partial [Candidatus Parcubacteria bacterium]|nr:hypothetical protein [Candidatus Parcubacteria bacterium]
LYLAPGQIVGVAGTLSVWEQSESGLWKQCVIRGVATVECEDAALDLTQAAGHVTVAVSGRIYAPGTPKLTGVTVVVRAAPPHLNHLLGASLTVRFAEDIVLPSRRPKVFSVIQGGVTAPKAPRHSWSV